MSRAPREIFDDIRTLSAGSADVDPFVQAIHELVSVMQMAIGSVIEPGQKLYRATNHHTSVPQFASEIMYPPSDRVRTLGRCNRVGQSVFYCSSDQNCVLYEINPSVGDLVVRATWQTTRRMFLQDLGFTPEVLVRAGATRELPDKYRNFVETLPDDARAIRDYIASAFTDRTDRNYALTAAIAEVHLRSDDVVGVMYPSITRNANADNLALQPSFVDQGLALIAAEALRVRKWNTTDPDAYGIADLAPVERDGRLVWSYTGHELTHVPNQQPSAMLLKPGEMLTIQGDPNAEIALNGQRYVVNPGYTIRLEDDKITVRDQTGALVSPA